MKYLTGLSSTTTLAFFLMNVSVSNAMPISKKLFSNFIDLPACYFKTKNGKVMDLTRMCGFIRPTSCTESLGSSGRDRVLADFCRQNEKCLLTNTCNEMPRGIYAPPPGTPVGALLHQEFFV